MHDWLNDKTMVARLAVVVSIVVVVVFDVAIWYWLGAENTISAVALKDAKRFPIIPLLVGLAIGIVIGHIYWANQTR